MENSSDKQMPPYGAAPLAQVMRWMASATIEPKSQLMLPPTWCASYREVGTTASIVVRDGVRVRVFGGLGGL
jgi:hypothetical protein